MNKSLLQVIHEDARDLYKAGLLSEITLREFDALRLPRIRTYTPAQIRKLRLRCKASQTAFAAFLNTSKSTVQQWEQGKKRPNGPSLKLLNLVDRKGIEILV